MSENLTASAVETNTIECGNYCTNKNEVQMNENIYNELISMSCNQTVRAEDKLGYLSISEMVFAKNRNCFNFSAYFGYSYFYYLMLQSQGMGYYCETAASEY